MVKKILLVEDEPTLCEIYTDLLREAGFHVTTVMSGSAVLPATQTQNFDLILLDVMLPELDGLQILKKMPRQLQQKTVMLTNFGEAKIIAQAKKLHVKGYLVKSQLDPAQFVLSVKMF